MSGFKNEMPSDIGRPPRVKAVEWRCSTNPILIILVVNILHDLVYIYI